MRFRTTVFAFLLSATLAAHADQITQSISTAAFNTVLSTSTTVAGFDPSLGTLNSVAVSLTAPIDVTSVGTYPPVTAPIFYVLAAGGVQLANGAGSYYSTGTYTIDVTGTSSSQVALSDFTGVQSVPISFEGYDAAHGGGAFTSTGLSGTITYNYTSIAATPEPSSLALLGTGILGAAGLARKRFSPTEN